ncbi:MAG TPA: phage terminase large subunit [Clostridia bacterium]|nr:phage terminase large subunit [Clostridia bacterium]
MKLHLVGVPNAKQELFFASTTRHTCYGGARGGGKSWAMRRKFVLLALRYSGLKLLLLRRTLPELTENHLRPLMAELASVAVYNQTRRTFTFPNGSVIRLGYCDAAKDVYQYQGQEYDVVGLEEATHFTEEQTQFITTCNRTVRSDFSPRMYYTCNPGGVGHAWVKRLFIDRSYRASERDSDYLFIPARVVDNPVLMQNNPDYITTLQNLPEPLRKAYLDGNWDVLKGQYFSEFDRDRHVVPNAKIPEAWRRFRAMDWGYNDPCCVLWCAVGPEGSIVVYRELYVRQLLSSQVAQKVCALTGNERIAYTVASPDAWQQRGISAEGRSIAEVFAQNGVHLLPADNSRVIGWQRVREALALGADGRAKLAIQESCTELIRTLPLLTFDEHDSEDVADTCEDHAPEALRYALMSRPKKADALKPATVPPYDPFSPVAPTPRAGFVGL